MTRALRLAELLLGGLLPGLLLLGGPLLPGCSQEDTRPDLVLVVVDTLRADHLGAYGWPRPTSPALDALGASGAVFTDNLSQSSWTLPSMASMLTGRRVFVNAQRLPDSVPSLAERLATAGYETIAFVGNPAMTGPGSTYARGFQTYVGREDTGNQTWTAEDLRRTASDWLAKHPRKGKPRLVWLHFMDPHFPYEPGDGPPLQPPAVMRDDTLAAWVEAVQAAPAGSPLHDRFEADRAFILEQVDAYDHEVLRVDAALASLLPQFGDRPRLVVVAADHGEMLWDHRHHDAVVAEKVPPEERSLREVFFRDHSYHLFQELVRTPLIVAGAGFPPGAAPGVRSDVPTENVDIAPTLLRAAGLADDPALDGRPLQDVLAGTARPRPFLLTHCNEATGVRTDDGWKFVSPTHTGDKFGMPMQLYHLPDDPHERRNLAPVAGTPPTAEIASMLRGLIKIREDAAAAFHLYDNEAIAPEDAEHMRRLEELGYVGGK